MSEPTPGGAADGSIARLWECPHCGFLVGWIDADDNLVIWRYDVGCITILDATFKCHCGAVIQWRRAVRERVLVP